MLAFVFGDYCSQLLPSLCTPSLGAILAIISMTTTNLMGTQKGARMQNFLTAAKIFGLIFVLIVGVTMAPPLSPSGGSPPNANPSFGLAMVFVLLTFGGWNEAAYLSAELRAGKHSMVRALLWGLGAITAIYLLAGFSYLKGLGMDEMSRSEVVAADLMRKVLGVGGANFVSLLIAVSALGAINATIFTGARSNYAVGRDFVLFNSLGRWQEGANTPVNALLLQGVIASALVLLGTATRGVRDHGGVHCPDILAVFFTDGRLSRHIAYQGPRCVPSLQDPLVSSNPGGVLFDLFVYASGQYRLYRDRGPARRGCSFHGGDSRDIAPDATKQINIPREKRLCSASGESGL